MCLSVCLSLFTDHPHSRFDRMHCKCTFWSECYLHIIFVLRFINTFQFLSTNMLFYIWTWKAYCQILVLASANMTMIHVHILFALFPISAIMGHGKENWFDIKLFKKQAYGLIKAKECCKTTENVPHYLEKFV